MKLATTISSGIHLRILPPRPKPLDEVFDDILKDSGVQLVYDVLSVTLGQDQVSVLEHAQVPGNGRPAGGELFGDLARCPGPGAEKLEDLAAGGVGQGSKDVVHSS